MAKNLPLPQGRSNIAVSWWMIAIGTAVGAVLGLWSRLQREGRLLQNTFWDRCTLFDVNYLPRCMTVEELEAGLRWLFTETYSADATAARIRSFVRQRREGRMERVWASSFAA